MPNVAAKIASHNKKILGNLNSSEPQCEKPSKLCNCRIKSDCPLNGKCLQESVLYKATVKDDKMNIETYVGITSGPFKERFNCHKSSFKLPYKASSTTLSGHIWDLKKSNTAYSIKWEILDSAPSYNPQSGRCILCLKEKQYILFIGSTLNSRSEIANTCRHKKKFKLSS